MDRVYVFLIRNDVWIYIICGLGLLWYLNELIRSQSALQRAMFGLERETSLRKRNAALLFVIFFSAIAAAVIYVNREIRPNLPPELLRPPTPTIDSGFAPATIAVEGTPEMEESEATPTSPIAPTVTLPGQQSSPITETLTDTLTTTVTDTITSTEQTPPLPDIQTTGAPPQAEEPTTGPQVVGCTPDAIITEPREGASILGLLNVFGSANTADFGYYEIEIRGPQTNDRWASLVGRRITQPVTDGILAGNVNLSPWAPGTYDVRLTISDENEEISHQCSVSISLQTDGGE